jgi:hypothetical protein
MSGNGVGPVTRSGKQKKMGSEEEQSTGGEESKGTSGASSYDTTTSQETNTWSHGTSTAEQTTNTASLNTPACSSDTDRSFPLDNEVGNFNASAGARGIPVPIINGQNVDATELVDAILGGSGASRDKATDANLGGSGASRDKATAAILGGSGTSRDKATAANLGGTVSSRDKAVGAFNAGAALDVDLTRSVSRTGPVDEGLAQFLPGSHITLDEHSRAEDERLDRLRAETELRASELDQARAAATYAAARYEMILAESQLSARRTPSPTLFSRPNMPSTSPEKAKPARNVSPRREPHTTDRNTTAGEISALRDAIVQAISMNRTDSHSSPPPQQSSNKYIGDLPFFDGNPSDWISFKRVFLDTENSFSDIANMGRLRRAVKGQARDSVRAILHTCSNPYEVIDALDRSYGKPDVIILAEIQNVKRMSRMSEDGRNISEFSNRVCNVVSSITALNKPQYLYAPELVSRIVEKLNNIVKFEWYRYKAGNESMPELLALSRFLKELSVNFNSMFAYEQAKQKSHGRSRQVNNINSKRNFRTRDSSTSSQDAGDQSDFYDDNSVSSRDFRASKPRRHRSIDYDTCSDSESERHYVATTNRRATRDKRTKGGSERKPRPQPDRNSNFIRKNDDNRQNKCVVCAGNHSIIDCADFLKQNITDRWETVKRFRLCFKCLGDAHRPNSNKCRYKACGKGGCEAAHHVTLHGRSNINSKEKVIAVKEHVSSVNHANQSQAYLKIIPVQLSGSKGSVSTYALMDEGATLSLIQKDIADEVTEPGRRETLSFEGVGGHEVVDHNSSRVKIRIRGMSSRESHDLTAHTVDRLNLASQSVNRSVVSECSHLRHLEDELCYESAQPTVLIGQDSWHLIVSRQICEGGKQQPCASLTQLGWVLHGVNEKPRRLNGSVNHVKPTYDNQDPALALIREHFSIESLGIEPRKRTDDPEDRAVQILEKTCKRLPGQDRFEAGLLWKTDNETLPENRTHALKRLHSLEKRLDSDSALKLEYNRQMNDFLDQGFAERIDTNPDSSRVFYLPHFPVFHKKKGKMRLVHDAACRTSGKALNDAILTGPDLIQSLFGVLIRFREGKVGVISDIKQMFLQIKMIEKDRDSLRFLWRGDDRDSPPQTYRMTSLIFGSAASPATAIYVKNKNANDCRDTYPEVAKLAERNFYVDDFLGAFDTIEQAQRTISDMDKVFKKASFVLCGWASNEPTVLNDLKNVSTEPTTVLGKSDRESTLGLLWNHHTDSLGFNLNLLNTPPDVVKGFKVPTKRQVTSAVFSVFDPTGLATPVTILGKMLIQDLWRASCEWDEAIPDNLNRAWREWIESLDLLQNLAVPRHIPRSKGPIHLHVFTDASEKAYAAAVYIVTIDSEGNRSSHLVSSKARVTPLKCISIPRLELQATILGCRLADSVKRETDYEIHQTHYWTDSRTVLAWIRSDPRSFKPFVAHRLAELETYTRPSDWHWVPTSDNVADLATRGVKTDFDIKHRWFSGPQFILEPPDKWPKPKETTQTTVNTGEERNLVNTVTASEYTKETYSHLPDTTRFSRYIRLQRSLGRLLLAIEIFTRKRTKSATSNDLDSRHLLVAEHLLLQRCQKESFAEELTRLRNNDSVPKSSKLYRLATKTTADGLLTLDGRYKINSATNQRQPIILDIKNRITQLIVQHYHEQFNHGNHHTVINELQQKYHIIGLRSHLRNIHARCQWCKVKKTKPVKYQLGDLPPERLMHHQPAFTATATDFFGPIKVTIGRRVEKRWGALYTCLTTRAVHVEIANSLSASSMIQTLRRMMARRGTPTIIYSDNGTNYIGAEREIREALDSAELSNFLTNKRIIWKKIPPGAPSMGGAWEVMVKCIKNALYHTLRDKIPSEDTLHTLLLEAEHIVNSRPLTPINANLTEEQLTPNHFLIQRSNGMTPFGSFSDKKTLKNTWQEVQQLAERFWKKWLIEYKPILLPRKRAADQPNLKPGDVVLIVDSTLPRGTWPRGLIEKVYPGPDGKVRVTEVRTIAGLIRRPTSRLILIN